MMERLLSKDQYDQSGFLVGPKTDDDMDKEGRQIDILRAIHGDTQETVDQLARIADGISQLSVAPTPGVATAHVVADQAQEQDKSPLHAAPVEPAGEGRGGQHDAPGQATLTAADEPAVVVQLQIDQHALPGVNAPPPPVSSPARAFVPAQPKDSAPASAPPNGSSGRSSLPPVVQPVIADPQVAIIEATARERRRREREAPLGGRQPPEQARQANGRFGSGQAGGEPASAHDGGIQAKSGEALAAASESLKNAARGIADGADSIDPSVQAVKEVSAVVSPVLGIFKPLTGLFSFKRSSPAEKRHRTDVLWYRRIWGALRDKKSDSRLGILLTGLAAMLGMLLAPIKALARVLGITRGLAAMGGLARAAGGLLRRRGRAGRNGRPGRGGHAQPRTGRQKPVGRSRQARTADAMAEKASARRNATEKPGAPPHARSTKFSTVSTKDTKTLRYIGRERTSSVLRSEVATPGPTAAEHRGKVSGQHKGAESTNGTKSIEAPARKAGRLSRATRGALGAVGGLAKRIPYIGTLLGLGAIATTAMAKEDPGATPEQRQQARAQRFGTYGSVAGGALGGVLGMFGGPAGAIAGGILGEQLGETVGKWLSTVDLRAMVDGVSGAFLGLAKNATDQVANALDYVRAKWDGLVAAGASALSGVTDWAKLQWTVATDKLAAARDTAADKYANARQAVTDRATSIKDAGQNVLRQVTNGRYTGGSDARKDELIRAMDAGGITDAKSKAALMANVDHESQGFTRSEENLNYSAKRLQQVFPKYYSSIEQARADAGNPEAIANRVYGGRMGNTEAGDGFKYRGRGAIQLTGKHQYEAMGKKLGVDLVNNPELASDPKYSAQIAVQYWKDSGANAAAIRGNVTQARVLTNGGTNGLEDVKSKYDKYLVQSKAGDLTPTRRADQVQVAPPAAAAGAITDTMARVTGHSTAVPGVIGQKVAMGAGPLVLARSGDAPGSTPGILPGRGPLVMAPTPGETTTAAIGGVSLATLPFAADKALAAMRPQQAQPSAAPPAGASGAVPRASVQSDAEAARAAAPFRGPAGQPRRNVLDGPALAAQPRLLGMLPIPAMQAAPASAGLAPIATPSLVPKVATAAPVTLKMPPLPTYSAPAADASSIKVPSTPSVTKPLLGGSSKSAAAPQVPMRLSQDMDERGIAHAATGGLGGQSIGRM